MSNKRSTGSRTISGITGLIVIIVAIVVSLLGSPQTPQETATPGGQTALPAVTSAPGTTQIVSVPGITQGFGAEEGFWAVYFTAPTGSRDSKTYSGGIDGPLATAINNVQSTLDIAAFEFNNPLLTQAVLAARQRGVQVRMVTDDEHGLQDSDSTVPSLIAAGIPVVDDKRTALMHNKFMILDGSVVFTGSLNYTVNGVYRNNNNLLMLRSVRAAQSYQSEFNEMFVDKKFGPTSPTGNGATLNQDGTPIQILFASEDPVASTIQAKLAQAQSRIRFMAFSFTLDDLGSTILQRASAGVSVEGIFETTGSETRFSELTPLFCAGLGVRQDGNPFVFHHKVFIIDDTVVAGSFNFSSSAADSNDENVVIITNHDLAEQYIAEFERDWAAASTPTGLKCS